MQPGIEANTINQWDHVINRTSDVIHHVSESWLRKIAKNPEISIPNYNIFRQDRIAKGGGVAIYCSESLQGFFILSKQFELLLLKIHLSRNKSLTVAACYRPPSAPSCALDTICELIAPIYLLSSCC
jgi:hypothetical protein